MFFCLNFRAIIEENVHWNEEIGEWQLKCVAYTGNNMRRRSDEEELKDRDQVGTWKHFLV